MRHRRREAETCNHLCMDRIRKGGVDPVEGASALALSRLAKEQQAHRPEAADAAGRGQLTGAGNRPLQKRQWDPNCILRAPRPHHPVRPGQCHADRPREESIRLWGVPSGGKQAPVETPSANGGSPSVGRASSLRRLLGPTPGGPPERTAAAAT